MSAMLSDCAGQVCSIVDRGRVYKPPTGSTTWGAASSLRPGARRSMRDGVGLSGGVTRLRRQPMADLRTVGVQLVSRGEQLAAVAVRPFDWRLSGWVTHRSRQSEPGDPEGHPEELYGIEDPRHQSLLRRRRHKWSAGDRECRSTARQAGSTRHPVYHAIGSYLLRSRHPLSW